ncbi:hypothetical protein [Faecalitalea cylindroides]|jgi:hypothetical protein|nr:hypothetical protein [Faecalitalea cylindroides]MEE1448592.1 hypothetical protein [Faecalitalea cylindroides]
MKFLEVFVIALEILLIAALIGILIQVLADVVYWPILWIFELSKYVL